MRFVILFMIMIFVSCGVDDNSVSTEIDKSAVNTQRNMELKESILKNRVKWDSLNIKNYRYSLYNIPYSVSGGVDVIPMMIYVSDNKVDSTFDDATYDAINADKNGEIILGMKNTQISGVTGLTIDTLFDIMLDATENGYYQFSRSLGDTSLPSFDSTYFFPNGFYIDYYKTENEYDEGKEIASNKMIMYFEVLE